MILPQHLLEACMFQPLKVHMHLIAEKRIIPIAVGRNEFHRTLCCRYVRSGMSGRWFDHFRWILQAGQWNSLSFRVYFCNVRNAGVSDHQSWRDHRRTDWEWWEKLGIGFCADLCYNIANREAIPQNYWINTSSNAEVKEFIRQSKNLTTKREIERLMSGESITKTIYPELTYKEMYFWNMGLRVIWNGVR